MWYFQNLNSRCSDRLNSPLQNDVVNLKKLIKEGNDIDFQISTSNRFNHLTVNEPSREEVGQVGQLHTANRQNKKPALTRKNLNRKPPVIINKKPENQHNFKRVKHHAVNDRNIRHKESCLGNRRKSKRIIMFSDSIPNGIKIHVVPILKEESFNSALIHIDINDILKDQSDLQCESLETFWKYHKNVKNMVLRRLLYRH